MPPQENFEFLALLRWFLSHFQPIAKHSLTGPFLKPRSLKTSINDHFFSGSFSSEADGLPQVSCLDLQLNKGHSLQLVIINKPSC